MQFITDFHLHSKYARATSPKNDIDGLSEGSKVKGINIIATGDYTHPQYFDEIKSKLKINEGGLFPYNGVRFILSCEISLIYPNEKKGRYDRMHHLVLTDSIETVAQINDRLSKFGDLKADGRPILKMSSDHFAEEIFSISNKNVIIPAHIWTPHFSVFGSVGGVNTFEEAFKDKSAKIFAVETGLSSDPSMNWMLSELDRFTLVSNSDAHSLEKLGREANVFDLEKPTYDNIINALKTRKGFKKTFEFYPEEGKYHYDGHRDCKVLYTPWETEEKKGICPVCKRKLTIGVLNRVYELSDRKLGFRPNDAVDFQHIVPLHTIISKVLKKAENSVKVAQEYDKLVRYFGTEFSVFDAQNEKIRMATTSEIADAIIRVKTGDISWVPGYDGVFGELVLDSKISKEKKFVDKKQKNLDEF